MNTSVETDKISEALAKAQGEMKNPEKNQTARIPMKSGGTYSYNYADLPATIEAVRGPLAKYGLAHTAAVTRSNFGTTLTVRLSHASGQWLQSEMDLPASSDPKSAAANLTYFRRYLLTGLVGIAADEDLDSEPEHGATYSKRTPADASKSDTSTASKQKVVAKAPVKPKIDLKPSEAAKPVEVKATTALDYCPTVGKWTGKRLGDFSTAELETYAETLTRSLKEQGKSHADLPPAHRELYENLMAATALSFAQAVGGDA